MYSPLLAQTPRRWTPRRLAGLIAWWKAHSLSLSDGAAVASWADSSGDGNTASQATGASQPIYKANILNGWPVVRFDGAATYLATTTFTTITQPSTLFLVANGTTAAATHFFCDGISSTARLALLHSTNTAVQLFCGAGLNHFSVDTTQYLLYSLLPNGASSGVYVNGGTLASGNAGSQSLTGLTIGASFGAGNILNGNIAEILLYNRALSTTDRQRVESYLRYKYALY